MSFKVTGRITVLETGIPIPTLCIQVWDKDLVFDDDLGEVQTDADGVFTHQFERADFDDFGIEAFPDLYLVVTTVEGREILDTSARTRFNASENEHFEIRLPAESILEEDGQLYWQIRPRVVGELSVKDGDTPLPSYIDRVADALAGLVVELWDPIANKRLAVDEPQKARFSLWYWAGAHPDTRELELRIKRGEDGTECFRSSRFGTSLDTQTQDIELQSRVLLLGKRADERYSFSHAQVDDDMEIQVAAREVITVDPAPPRRTAPPAASGTVSPFAGPSLPSPEGMADDSVDEGEEEPPEPYRMILPPRPKPVASVSDDD